MSFRTLRDLPGAMPARWPSVSGKSRSSQRCMSFAVAEFASREIHLIKRALAIATLAVEWATDRSHSGDADMQI